MENFNGRSLLGIGSFISLLKTVDFAENNVSYQKNGNSENGRASRLHRDKYQKERTAKRIHLPNMAELADFVGKSPKRLRILKEREFKCFFRPSEKSASEMEF